MENDSPNLFDSEPVTVQLTVPENTAHDDDDRDNVLTEILHGVRDDGVPDERDTTDEVRNNAVVEYHTDDDGDGDGDGDGDEGAWVDENVDLNDRSAADQELNDDDDDDRPADRLTETDKTHGTKARDVHKGLPPGRVKLIMKMDPDVNIVAADAVYILTKATVMTSVVINVPIIV